MFYKYWCNTENEMWKISLIFLCVDAEKAFDRIEWTFSKLIGEKIELGHKLRTWIEVVYNPLARVMVNWQLSKGIKLSRGVRQGCPLSPFLVNICLEILAIKIRNTNEFKGIKVQDKEFKLAQYAVDVVFFLTMRIYFTKWKFCRNMVSFPDIRLIFKKSEIMCLNIDSNERSRIQETLQTKWKDRRFQIFRNNIG